MWRRELRPAWPSRNQRTTCRGGMLSRRGSGASMAPFHRENMDRQRFHAFAVRAGTVMALDCIRESMAPRELSTAEENTQAGRRRRVATQAARSGFRFGESVRVSGDRDFDGNGCLRLLATPPCTVARHAGSHGEQGQRTRLGNLHGPIHEERVQDDAVSRGVNLNRTCTYIRDVSGSPGSQRTQPTRAVPCPLTAVKGVGPPG